MMAGRHWGRQAVVSGVLGMAVGASLLVAPAAQAAPGQASPLIERAPKVIAGKLSTPPALSLSGHLVSPGRVGGRAIFDVVLASTSPGGKAIKGLEVRIAAPRGTSFAKVGGEGWRCTRTTDRSIATCAHPRTLDRDENPSHIRAILDVSETFVGRRAEIRGWARWRGERTREGSWVVSERNDVPIHPRATLSVTSSAPVVTVFRNGTDEQRQFQLTAKVGRLEGLHASLTWRQVSGPRVRFLSPRKVGDVDRSAEQLVQVVSTPRKQRYVFAARVVAQGQVVEKRVSVVALGGMLLGEVDAATPSEAAIAESTELSPLEGVADIESTHDLRIAGPRVARTGARVTLTAAGTDARRGVLRWTIDGTPAGSGRTLDVRAPATPGETVLIGLETTLPSGVAVATGHVLVAGAAPAPAPRASIAPRKDSAFCTIAKAIDADGTRVFDLGAKKEQRFTFSFDKTTVGEGVFDASGACTGSGEITMTGATLIQSENVRLANATATLTPSGLTVTSARMTVKSTLSNKLTDTIGLDLTGTIEAPLSGDAFGLAQGSAAFAPVSVGGAKPVSPFSLFLDEPDGWEFLPDASQVTFGTGLSDDLAVRLTQVATSPANAQGTRGTVSLSVDIVGDTPTKATVSIANLTLGETPKGGLIMVESAKAKVVPTADKKGVEFSATLPITCQGGWESEQCALFGGFRFDTMSLDWSTSEKKLSATAAIAFGGGNSYALNFTGTYRGDRDWEIVVTNPKDWQLGKGMTFSKLKGSITSKPNGATAADVSMSITGSFSGLALGGTVKVSDVTPKLTNECAADAPADCSLAEMKLYVTAALQATLPGKTSPATFQARADINLTTLDFTFESGASDLDVGPAALKLTGVKLVVSRGADTACTPKGTSPPKADGVTVRFQGNAQVLAVNYVLNVQSDSRGLCLWGTGDSIALGGGLEAVSPVLAYTTYAAGATVDGGSDIDANKVVLVGGFLFPDSLGTRFSIPGEGVTFKADLATDMSQASFQVQYNAAGEVALYQGDGAALLLEGVGFGLDLTMPQGGTPAVDAYFFGRARLDLAGTPPSSTPLEVRIGVKYSGAQFKIAVQGGLVSGGAENAFGVDGLTMRELSVSAEFDIVTTTPTIGLNADVTLPPGWTSSIGIADGTPVRLAASLDALKPCLRFSMGTEDGADIVDFGGVGFLTANYVQLLLAPAGCTVPSGAQTVTIDAGWAVDVRGRMLGSPVAFAAGFSVSASGIRLGATVAPPALEFYGVTLRGKSPGTSPTLTFFIDTGTGTFEASVDAGLEIGNVRLGRGLLVEVKGEIRKRSDYFEIDIAGSGSIRLGPVGLDFNPVEVDANIPRPGGSTPLTVDINTTVTATLDLSALGSYSVVATGRLKMTGATVSEIALTAGGSFDAKLYKLSGTIALNLCTGTLTPVAADGTGSVCTEFSPERLASSSPAVRVSAYGTQKWALKDPKPFTKVFYEREAVEG